MNNWTEVQTFKVNTESSWIIELKWKPNLDSDKKGLIYYKTKSHLDWYETKFEVNWNTFQEIINLKKGIGKKLREKSLIK